MVIWMFLFMDEMPKRATAHSDQSDFQSKRQKVLQFLQDHIAKGRQAYVVFPLVEESEKMELKNATDEYEKLKKDLPDLKIGLVHGK